MVRIPEQTGGLYEMFRCIFRARKVRPALAFYHVGTGLLMVELAGR